MKKCIVVLSVSLLMSAAILFTGCSKKNDPPPTLTSTTYKNLVADPATTYDPATGAPSGYLNKFTFFNFSTGLVVANADSATTKWDIGFNRTTIIFNSGTSGPGIGGAILQTAAFSDVTTAPDTGFKTDNEPSHAALFASQTPDSNLAIPTGSDNGWYHYDPTAHTILPIAGRVFIIKTANAKYAKMEILSFYKNAPTTPDANTDQDSNFTFRYIFQPDSGKNLSGS